ncbi:hypothetical protein D9M72_445630 [compost metagenome]
MRSLRVLLHHLDRTVDKRERRFYVMYYVFKQPKFFLLEFSGNLSSLEDEVGNESGNHKQRNGTE